MTMGQSRGFRRAMAWSPAGLLGGFALGMMAHANVLPKTFEEVLGPLGNLWARALQLAVFPLVVSLLVTGIGSLKRDGGLSRWGALAVATFIALLLLGAGAAWALAAGFLALYAPATADLGSAAAAPEAAKLTFGGWIESLLPANLVQAMANGEMLPVTLSAILFGLAVRQLPEPPRARLVEVFRAVLDALLIYLGWVLILMPFAAFALAYAFTAQLGLQAAGAALQFLLLSVGALAGMTLLLYLLVAIFSKVGVARFARAAYPVQVLAAGSRSSLACLPSLVEATRELRLPSPAGDLVLPLAASVFKPNRTVSSTVKLLFLGALCGVTLSIGDIVAFILTVIVLSVSTPGLPSMGTRITFGAYLAAGLPPAAILLFEALDPIIDVFKTVYNATANLASAAIVSRLATSKDSTESEPDPGWVPEAA